VGQLYYNGIPTIVAKTELAKAETSGVMIWELGQDASGPFANLSLLRAIDEALHPASGSTAVEGTSLRPLLYPVPATALLNVEGLPLDACQAQVLDFQGNRKWAGTLASSAKLNLEGWPAGVYALQLILKNGSYTYPFVKI
jgi:hypothetical protein